MQSIVGCIIFLIINGHHATNSLLNATLTYLKHVLVSVLRNVHNHAGAWTQMPLLGNQKLDEYIVVLEDGQEVWTEFVMAPDSEHAAWAGYELSTNRNAYLKDVIRTDEW